MKRKTVEYGKYGYIFIAPFFLVFLIFQLYPLLYTFYLSFVNYRMSQGKWCEQTFCGFDNFMSILSKKDFKSGGTIWFDTLPMNSIKNTAILWIVNFIPQILLALLLAAWFTDTVVKLKGQGAFKVMMFLPNIITASSIMLLSRPVVILMVLASWILAALSMMSYILSLLRTDTNSTGAYDAKRSSPLIFRS